MAAAGGAAMRVRRAQLARGGAALKFDGSHPSKLPWLRKVERALRYGV